jgi:hypothetical protein
MLRCAFGSPWGPKGCGPCKKCLAECERLSAEFWRAVFFGEYDRDGYQLGERSGKRLSA